MVTCEDLVVSWWVQNRIQLRTAVAQRWTKCCGRGCNWGGVKLAGVVAAATAVTALFLAGVCPGNLRAIDSSDVHSSLSLSGCAVSLSLVKSSAGLFSLCLFIMSSRSARSFCSFPFRSLMAWSWARCSSHCLPSPFASFSLILISVWPAQVPSSWSSRFVGPTSWLRSRPLILTIHPSGSPISLAEFMRHSLTDAWDSILDSSTRSFPRQQSSQLQTPLTILLLVLSQQMSFACHHPNPERGRLSDQKNRCTMRNAAFLKKTADIIMCVTSCDIET